MAIGIIIAVVVIAAAVIGYVATNPDVLASLKKINPIDMTRAFVPPARGDPVNTYAYCYSFIRGSFQNDNYDYVETDCYNKRFNWIMSDGSQKRLASFKFTLPPALDDLEILRATSSVYQYEENDFELGIYDEVGEKRYDVKLWELPT